MFRLLQSKLIPYFSLPSTCQYGIILNLIQSSLSGICFFLSFYFVKYLDINITTSGFMISCYALGTAIGGFVGGRLSDKFTPKQIAAWSLFLEGLAFMALTQAQSVLFIIPILITLGFALYSFLTAINVWIIEQSEQNETLKIKAINLIYTSSNLGFGIASVLIILIGSYSFSLIFAISGIGLVGAAIHFLNYNKKQPAFKKIEPLIINKTEEIPLVSHKPSHNTVLVVMFCVFVVGMMVSQRGAIYLIYVHHLFPDSGITGIGLVFVLNPLLIVLFQIPIVNLFKSMEKILVVGLGAFLMGTGMGLLIVPDYFSLIIAACIIYTIGEMLFFAMAQFVCYEYAGKDHKGKILGSFKAIYASSMIVGPSLSTLIYHHISPFALWGSDAMLGSFCLALCLASKK